MFRTLPKMWKVTYMQWDPPQPDPKEPHADPNRFYPLSGPLAGRWIESQICISAETATKAAEKYERDQRYVTMVEYIGAYDGDIPSEPPTITTTNVSSG